MPMLDAFIPERALAPDAEATLLRELTDILMRHEGVDPSNKKARAVSLVFVHRPTIYVAGAPASSPRYRFIPSVMEGLYDDARRAAIVHDVTAAVARAEGSSFEDVAPRVWVFPTEVPDGRWGGRGVIRRLPEFLRYVMDEEAANQGARRLIERRRREAEAIVRAAKGGESSERP
jgi:phenylpyruvate tautomerase PptA (4-oxalocrotonate tautomerase family)